MLGFGDCGEDDDESVPLLVVLLSLEPEPPPLLKILCIIFVLDQFDRFRLLGFSVGILSAAEEREEGSEF